MAKRNESKQDNTQTGRGVDFGVDRVSSLGHPLTQDQPINNKELNQANKKRVSVQSHPGVQSPHQ